MIEESELQIDGSRVYQKTYTGSVCDGVKYYNWELIATFHFKKGNPSPETMAKTFYNAIMRR
jgi:hypothetical protein